MVSNLDHVTAEEKLSDGELRARRPEKLRLSGPPVVDCYVNGKGLQPLRVGPAIKDHFGGRRKKQNGQSKNGHAN